MRIVVNSSEIEAFKNRWPCSGIPELSVIEFSFDSNGALVDIDAYGEDTLWVDSREFDGAALVALSQDAQNGVVGRKAMWSSIADHES